MRLYRHATHEHHERCFRCADMPVWAEEMFIRIFEIEELLKMTQADIDAETIAVQANTAELAQVVDAVAVIEAFIVANPTTPVADLDLSGLKQAISDQAAASAAALAAAQADVAGLPVVVPPGANPADVTSPAIGVAHPDPVAAAAATNPGALPVDPIADATAVDAPVADPAAPVAEPVAEPVAVDEPVFVEPEPEPAITAGPDLSGLGEADSSTASSPSVDDGAAATGGLGADGTVTTPVE